MTSGTGRSGGSRSRWQTRAGWTTAAIGLVLFLAGNLGARAGFEVLPFDPHHVYAQLGGAALAVIGAMWAISGDRR